MRISPVRGNGRRYTYQATVEVSPILDKSVEFEIPEKDLEITVPRPQGSVNRPETWVRVLHIPTGISVFCNQERRQLESKEKGLAILKSKLLAIALAQGVQQVNEIQPWQIKSLSKKLIREYVLHPYKKVKDLCTKLETTAVTDVLDGEIDLFLKASIQQNQTTAVSK
ncbi:MAG: peptide chain release factor-like protein [Nostoc sp. ChiSLP02]|nr:peptide chain release factor-like protein [Nostoc sp. DedSLP05]MDZ8103037.1 peptide chain release factor-like protein [Nostoc sp. DedSLP01]MDZ8183406.1 peptide chain release factor-like protein [Nostoc sp. ChiSLP02]